MAIKYLSPRTDEIADPKGPAKEATVPTMSRTPDATTYLFSSFNLLLAPLIDVIALLA